MRYKAEPGTSIGFVGPGGEARKPIVFDDKGFAEVEGEEEEALKAYVELGLVKQARGKE